MNYSVNSKDNDLFFNDLDTSSAELSISKMSLDQRTRMIRRLLSVMMIAQTFDMCTTARTIYDAVVLFIDDIDQVRLCLAFSSAVTGNMRDADALRHVVFSDSPGADQKNLMLSFILSLNKDGDNNWRNVPQELLKNSSNPDVLRTAQLLLNQ
jgi:hypothetical protein